jgi:hypothetical protein
MQHESQLNLNYLIFNITLRNYIGKYLINLPLLITNMPFVRFDPLTSRMEANTPTIKSPHLL